RSFEKAREQHGLEPGSRVPRCDGVAHGVDPGAVEGLEEPGALAERLGDIPGTPRHGIEVGHGPLQRVGVDGVWVGRHVTPGERGRAPRLVDGGHLETFELEGLGDARGAREQVESGPGVCSTSELPEDMDEAALGPEVLDHCPPGSSGPSGSRSPATSSSPSCPKSSYHSLRPKNLAGVSTHTTSSATSRSASSESGGPTGTARTTRAAPRRRMTSMAARAVNPVASPSSTTIAVRPRTDTGARSPR